jgi:hypothetical protein
MRRSYSLKSNDNLLEGWITEKSEILEKMKSKYCVDDDSMDSIRKWIGEKFDTRQIIWPDAYSHQFRPAVA